jgi:hypothetical protein
MKSFVCPACAKVINEPIVASERGKSVLRFPLTLAFCPHCLREVYDSSFSLRIIILALVFALAAAFYFLQVSTFVSVAILALGPYILLVYPKSQYHVGQRTYDPANQSFNK